MPVKKKKLPKGWTAEDFEERATQPGARKEDWRRVGDLFFGVRLDGIYHGEYDVEFLITTTNIPASEAPTVTQEFWEMQLRYNLRRLERQKGK